jgi:chemotaxis protein CheX
LARAKSSVRRLTLPRTFGVTAVDGLVNELRAARGAALTLDAAEVEAIGGLGLQVLISARKTWREDGQALGLADPSDALAAAFALAGVAQFDVPGDPA